MDNTYDMGQKRGQEEGREEIERLKRNKDTWKAKALRLIDYNNKKNKEIEQLGTTLDMVRENIYDCGWINLGSFDKIVQAIKEKEDG